MLKCILVPDAVFVEHENLERLGVSKHKLRVERRQTPQQRLSNFGCIYFFKVFNVHCRVPRMTKPINFREHHLLSVRQQLSMISEVMHHCGSPGHEKQLVRER